MNFLLRALHVDLLVTAEDPRLGALVRDACIDLRATTPTDALPCDVLITGGGPWKISAPSHTGSASTLEAALSHALTAVNLTAVAKTPLLAFHAAVVSGAGGTLVLPGRSGRGKSTTTACLLRRGWAYVSDEALALDWATGRLVAYPRPMALSAWSCAAAGGVAGVQARDEVIVRARDLGAAVDVAPAAVRHVAIIERSPERAASLDVLRDRNVALEELIRRGFTHHQNGGRALHLLVELLRAAVVVRVSLGDPAQAADLLTQLVAA